MEFIISSDPFVNLRITSSINSFTTEKRFDKSLTVADLKYRIELLTGASAGSMVLSIYDEKDKFVTDLSSDTALIGSLPIEKNYRIHVVDNTKRIGEFEDVSKVEKFNLSEEEYSNKNDTVRAFLLKNKLGKYDEKEQEKLKREKEEADRITEEKAKSLNIGDRCEIRVQGEPTRRGCVKFVGKTPFKPGWWVGVQYDEPLGKNDGSVDGKRYFECMMKYGGFVRPVNVTVGDFPEILDDDMDEI